MSSPPRLYPTDLSDAEWRILEPLIPAPKPGGRPCRWSRRAIMNGIFYLVRSGCQWRLLPREFPPWKTVYHSFRAWRLDGTWEQLTTTLRPTLVNVAKFSYQRDNEPGQANSNNPEALVKFGGQQLFVGRNSFVAASRPLLPRWQEKLFLTLARVAANAGDFFGLPANRVVELGSRIEI